LTDVYEILHYYAKWVSQPSWSLKKIEFPKSKMADGRHFEKPLNRHISATVGPILMKFGTVTQICPLQETDR